MDTAWSTWSESFLFLSKFNINLVFPSVQNSSWKKLLIVGKGVILRQFLYSILSPIFKSFVNVHFSILDTILVMLKSSCIFPVLGVLWHARVCDCCLYLHICTSEHLWLISPTSYYSWCNLFGSLFSHLANSQCICECSCVRANDV